MRLAVLALAAQGQFGVFAEREKEGLDGIRLAGSGKGRLTAGALADPDRLDAAQTTCIDRVNIRHIGLAAVADQLFRTRRLDFGTRLRHALGLSTPLFCLSHFPFPRFFKARSIAGAGQAVDSPAICGKLPHAPGIAQFT